MTTIDTIKTQLREIIALGEKATTLLTRTGVAAMKAEWNLSNCVKNAEQPAPTVASADAGNANQDGFANGESETPASLKPKKHGTQNHESSATQDGRRDGIEPSDSTTQSTISGNGERASIGSQPGPLPPTNCANSIREATGFASTANPPSASGYAQQTQEGLIMSFLAPKEESTESKTWLFVVGDATHSRVINSFIAASRSLTPQMAKTLLTIIEANDEPDSLSCEFIADLCATWEDSK